MRDYLGSTRAVFDITPDHAEDLSEVILEQNDYCLFGSRIDNADLPTLAQNRFRFNGKEKLVAGANDTKLTDYGARMYSAPLARWTTPDPLADKYYSISPYAFSGNNPVNYVDPDGNRQWPVNEKFNGAVRRHENNFGASRPNNRTHNGLDINLGSGNDDLGTPVFATHSGTVTRYRKFNEDTDSGGNRIQITSENGEVATFYMHLDTMAELKEGDFVSEGDFIGTIGGSGKGSNNAYKTHLHYELKVDGVNVNPVIDAKNLIDPQTLIAPTIHEELHPSVVIGERKQIKLELPKLLNI